MQLRIITPEAPVLDTAVRRVVAEGAEGGFGLLPQHVDYVTRLVPGVLSYEPETGGGERFVGIDEGTLLKRGDEVLVATRAAVAGTDLAAIEAEVRRIFSSRTEEERAARSALARLEAQVVRSFRELGAAP